jgi:hypothetical protein
LIGDQGTGFSALTVAGSFFSSPNGFGGGAGGSGGARLSRKRAVGSTCGHTIGASIAQLTSAIWLLKPSKVVHARLPSEPLLSICKKISVAIKPFLA